MSLVEVMLAFGFLSAFAVAVSEWRADARLDGEARQLAAVADAAHHTTTAYLREFYPELHHCLNVAHQSRRLTPPLPHGDSHLRPWTRASGSPSPTDPREAGEAFGGEASFRWTRVPFFRDRVPAPAGVTNPD